MHAGIGMTKNLQNTAKDTLIVTIEKAADAGEAGNTEDTDVSQKCSWSSRLARKGQTMLDGSISELRRFVCRSHGLQVLQTMLSR